MTAVLKKVQPMIEPFFLRAALAAVVFAAAGAISSAADWSDMYEARAYFDPQGSKLLYRLLRPKDYDPQEKYPLVLFLHGAGERGDDNRAQLKWGCEQFASDENRSRYPCFVVVPQCPEGEQWVDVPWSADRHTMPEKPTAALRRSLELIEALPKEFSIDAGRLYITGLSMGGYGVWDAIQRRPDLFAAAAPVCGGGDPQYAKQIAGVPVWAFHGAKDTVVKPHRSREMVEAIRAADGDPKYSEFPDAPHNSWTPAYSDPQLYAWLFAQRKK
jgi:predicted peptidase